MSIYLADHENGCYWHRLNRMLLSLHSDSVAGSAVPRRRHGCQGKRLTDTQPLRPFEGVNADIATNEAEPEWWTNDVWSVLLSPCPAGVGTRHRVRVCTKP